jgi:predicted dehydrogenase
MPDKPSRVKLALLGMGFGRAIASQLLGTNAKDHIELAGVCDLDPERLAAAAAQTNTRAYASLDEILSDPTIEAVGIFTGPAGRAGLICKAIRAGKDVMTTKPFELDPSTARDVLQEADRLGRTVHLNSPSPLPAEDLRILTGWREEYDLGCPIACRVSALADYRESPDGGWYDDPALCPAAPIYRLGIYLLNDLLYFLGKAVSVCVMQTRIFTGRPTSDNAQLSIQFENGALANITSSFCVADGQPYRNSLTLNCERGTLYRNTGPMRRGDADFVSVVANRGETLETRTVSEVSGIYQWDVFRQSVRGERIPIDNERVVDAVRVVQAMLRSQESGKIELV